jgi:hypothetical protein
MGSPATPYVPTLEVDAVCLAIAAFLQPFVGTGTPIIRAYDNGTAPPTDPYVELTEILQVDIETPSQSYDGPNQQLDVTAPKRIDIQVDIVGAAAGSQATAVQAVMRTAYAVSQFPPGIAPLYCSDARPNPLITGEQQYDYRWTLTMTCQYNPVVSVPQQSATSLSLTVLEAIA